MGAVPYFISALYGQFLLLQLESAGSVFIIRFMMAMITLTLRSGIARNWVKDVPLMHQPDESEIAGPPFWSAKTA